MKSAISLFRSLALAAVCCMGCDPAVTLPHIEVYAHRGFRGLHPENTIQAMKKVLPYGAILELDLAISADKKVVVSHDPVLNPKITKKPNGDPLTKDEQYVLYQMDYSAIRQFDVGTTPNPDFPEQERYPAYIPLLSEVIDSVEALAAAEGFDPPRYFMETKLNAKTDGIRHPGPEEFVELLMEVVDEKNIRDRVIVQSFDPRTLQVLRRDYPEVKLAFLARAGTSLADNMEWLGFTPDYYSINAAYIDSALVSACGTLDMELIIGNCNDYGEIKRISALGVQRVISDFPITALAKQQTDKID
ncbi:glycerophosphodiester phosphodiesterase family protein [Parapedobacter deserti]|uniref:Glycerophosphodiester phosphodiesterase family protein n=1 Tax=Parapedobacter deserti TaxID=1912957 RepID=A0ABV7JK59_9SPHI